MISVQKGLELIIDNIHGERIKDIPPIKALGNVIAEDIISPDKLPRFSQSAMDGYAIRSDDLVKSGTTWLKIAGEVFPGYSIDNLYLNHGEAFEVGTGSPIPNGADAVIIHEDTNVKDDFIEFNYQVKRGDNIRIAGNDIMTGEIVAKKGDVVTPAMIGLFGALGIISIKVFMPPDIGIIVTGSELVSPEQIPGNYRIRDSNSWILTALLNTMNIPPLFTKRLPDTLDAVYNFLNSLKNLPDMVIVTGGVSVGGHDYVKKELEKFGINKLFWRVSQKPGKPMYAGIKGETVFFGLPGNPAAVLTCFYVYISSAIRRYMGRSSCLLPSVDAVLDRTVKGDTVRTCLPHAIYRDGKIKVLDKQDSHMLVSFAIANALVVLEPRETGMYQKGESVKIWLIQECTL